MSYTNHILTTFCNERASGKDVYLEKWFTLHKDSGYSVVTTKPESISKYAIFHLTQIYKISKSKNPLISKFEALKLASLIYETYKKELSRINIFQKVCYHFFSFLQIQPSSKSIEKAYQKIQLLLLEVPELGSALKNESPRIMEERRKRHRSLKHEGYAQHALTKNYFNIVWHPTKKEKAYQEIYTDHLHTCIKKKYYDPAIIPFDLEALLGPAEQVKKTVLNTKKLLKLLKTEIEKYQDKLTQKEIRILHNKIKKITHAYVISYHQKSFLDAFYFIRDLIRLEVYQIHYGKKAPKKEINKENDQQFIDLLAEFFYNIGCTTGLAQGDHDGLQDHPFIGSKMIEENKAYFQEYIGDAAYKALHQAVLYQTCSWKK